MEKFRQVINQPGKSRAPKKTQDAFRHWMIAFVVCNFNVDVGPEVELVYPPDVAFSKSDLMAICFNSFPDRHDAELTEDALFTFTVRNNSPDIILYSPCSPHGSSSNFYGCCVFRRESDQTSKRSFNQKTLTLISNQPFSAFFLKLLQKMTASAHILDPAMLEAAHSQISSWPSPSGGRHELAFMGSLMVLEIPPHHGFPLQGLQMPRLEGELSQMSLYAYQPTGSWSKLLALLPTIVELYVIYEKLILCEPVVILAKNPQLCSEFVSACVDLVRPVPYAGIVRPYLIMQSDFSSVELEQGTVSHFCIGITNPFLLQRIMAAAEENKRPLPHVIYLHESEKRVPIKKSGSQRHQRQAQMDFPGTMSLDTERGGKKYLKSDHTLTKTLDSILTDKTSPAIMFGMNEDADTLIRRHFAELTAQFLAPLNRYLASRMASSVFSPGGQNLSYANFSTPDFLSSLAKYGTSVKFRGQAPLQRHRARDSMYDAFCKSPNFYGWLEMKIGLEKEASAGLLAQPRRA